MKGIFLIGFMAVLLTACGGNTQRSDKQSTPETNVQAIDASTVFVYYFHGKQRCKTCIAVGNVAEETIKESYADNPGIKFVEIKTEEKQNEKLVEKYKVTWNALIVSKGDDNIDITKQAFANAVNSPEKLTALIKTEIDNRLTQ